MEKVSVMIIDDHMLIRETWAFLLGRNDKYRVVSDCGDGQKAIEIVKGKKPDIILLDINMMPLNGFDILKSVRKCSPTSKVIGVSMHSQPTYAKKMLRLGARGYLTKNSPRKEMLEAIAEVHSGNTYICKEVKNILSEQLFDNNESNTRLNHLSEREIEVVNLIREGSSSKEIGDRLLISVKTVEVHRHHILRKLKVKNTASLINYINASGL
jgi:DNA-binding NarL/FixJ family response regulator